MQRDDKNKPTWSSLSPPFQVKGVSALILLTFANKVRRVVRTTESVSQALQAEVEEYQEAASSWPTQDRQMLLAAGLVLTDLIEQGWMVRIRKEVLEVHPPKEVLERIRAEQAGTQGPDPLVEKERVRHQELLKRKEQLEQPSVQAFIQSMERRRLYEGRLVSIFSLMRDGRDLVKALCQARALAGEQRGAALDQVIDPYLQVVTSGEKCSWTGIDLQEIWRYFRHTWANQHMSVPGRSMMFLVRDRAAEFHPVMGIGALASPIVQIKERDKWIGWHPETFLPALRAQPTDRIACWLERVVADAIADLYTDDLLENQLLTIEALRAPTEEVVQRLLEEGAIQRKLHHRYVQSEDHKRQRAAEVRSDEFFWRVRARTHLFRSKRALALADLLSARMVLSRFFSAPPTGEQLARLLADTDGEQTIRRILRKAKGDRVGIAMADISVCGAIQPYNALLGGKLASMLAVSPEIILAYRDRYANAESEIASAMAGRPIIRPSHLVLFSTTSLYGVGSSQYNRIKIPCELLGGNRRDVVRYSYLGESKAYGTSQYSDDTVEALTTLVQHTRGTRVNSIFGEGVNPKMRKIREGLELLGAPGDNLLRHWRDRVLYGVSLVRNLREYLLGIDEQPEYLMYLSDRKAATKQIASWWKSRWLAHRIESDAVLSAVEQHTLIHPITHGARVILPKRFEDQGVLPFPGPF